MADKFPQQASPAGRTASATVKDGAEAPIMLEAILEAKKRLDAMPKLPIFASTRWAWAASFIKFKDGDQVYLVGHPDLWLRVPSAPRSFPYSPSALIGCQILDLDNLDDPRTQAVWDALARVAHIIGPWHRSPDGMVGI